jgi:DNA-binding transcriptional ArsR family regulator
MSAQSQAAAATAEMLRRFAQPQRLLILWQLLEGERTVGELERGTGIGQPALSQQLAELRRAGLVRARRAARQIHYSLADDETALRARSIAALFGSALRDDAAQRAREALAAVFAPPVAEGRPTPPVAAAFARLT